MMFQHISLYGHYGAKRTTSISENTLCWHKPGQYWYNFCLTSEHHIDVASVVCSHVNEMGNGEKDNKTFQNTKFDLA